MFFSERPKTSRAELFDRERELGELEANMGRPLILITGIRRIGKTSLLRVFLSECGLPYVFLDARTLGPNYSLGDLYRLLSKGLSASLGALRDVLSNVRRIRILGGEVELSWRGKDYIGLGELFDELNRKRVIIAVDEAQCLRGPRSSEFRNALAHAFDYDDNLTFVLTGSEAGLLYDFLGVEDPDSPLYGRYRYLVEVGRFGRSESLRFLEEGFRQAGVDVPREVLEEAVEAFDGIVGWLTFFGNEVLRGRRDVGEVKRAAVSVAERELRNMFSGRSRRHLYALRCLAEGRSGWSELKRCVEEREGGTVSSSVMDNVVRTLEAMSIIKRYEFQDPVYREAALHL